MKRTIYSSITGKTINLDNEIYEKEGYSSRDGDIFIGTRYMSYDTISTLAGINGGITLMASVTLAYYNVPYSSVVILITGVLAGLGIVTAGAFKLAFPNGGLKFDLYDIERSSVRGGVTHYYYVRSIKNVKHLSVI